MQRREHFVRVHALGFDNDDGIAAVDQHRTAQSQQKVHPTHEPAAHPLATLVLLFVVHATFRMSGAAASMHVTPCVWTRANARVGAPRCVDQNPVPTSLLIAN
jgi:hypothetical protein